MLILSERRISDSTAGSRKEDRLTRGRGVSRLLGANKTEKNSNEPNHEACPLTKQSLFREAPMCEAQQHSFYLGIHYNLIWYLAINIFLSQRAIKQ